MSRPGRDFFDFLSGFKEQEVAILSLTDDDMGLFDESVSKGSASEVLQLLQVLRGELMSQDDSPLISHAFLTKFMSEYVAAKKAVRLANAATPPPASIDDDKVTYCDGVGPVAGVNGAGYSYDPRQQYEYAPTTKGGGEEATLANPEVALSAMTPEMFAEKEKQGFTDHNSSVDNSDRAPSGVGSLSGDHLTSLEEAKGGVMGMEENRHKYYDGFEHLPADSWDVTNSHHSHQHVQTGHVVGRSGSNNGPGPTASNPFAVGNDNRPIVQGVTFVDDDDDGIATGDIAVGVPLAMGTVVGTPLPAGPIEGVVASEALQRYRTLKAMTAAGAENYDGYTALSSSSEPTGEDGELPSTATGTTFIEKKSAIDSRNGSPFLDFYRGSGSILAPDSGEEMDVMELVAVLPTVSDEELPFLTTIILANALFPIRLTGDSFADNTQIAKPLSSIELQYAKIDMTVRMRIHALVECYLVAMGLDSMSDTSGVIYFEAVNASAAQKAALSDPSQFRNCLRAMKLAEAVGHSGIAKGLQRFFGPKLPGVRLQSNRSHRQSEAAVGPSTRNETGQLSSLKADIDW